MAEQNWGKEPWHWLEESSADEDCFFEVRDCNGRTIIRKDKHGTFTTDIISDMRRAIVCVNACAGISQEVMERIANGRGFNNIIGGMMQQKFPKSAGHWTQQFGEKSNG